ncbi:MAG: hypothetical protein IKY33_01540 [Clostridia bacterium]|nr:hypothetical protein [Clostridia bacterium]
MEMRDRLIELMKEWGRANNDSFPFESVADHLIADGIIAPPCKVGDTAWFVLEDDFPVHKWYLSPEPVTEVCSRGFFVSGYVNDENDMSNYTPWTQVGDEVFFSEEAAKAVLRERNIVLERIGRDE